MNLESVYDYLLAKPAAEETFPFDEDTLVMKVMGKMFALIPLERLPHQINLKCDPERALELREQYEAVQPGYHMSKKHWNTVLLDGTVPPAEIRAMIDDSYRLVVAGLKKADQEKLEALS